MSVLFYILCVLTGIVLDRVIIKLFIPKGVLKIDSSNPEKDVYNIDVGDLDSLKKRKHYILKIEYHTRN